MIVPKIVLVSFSVVFWRVRNISYAKWKQLSLKYMEDWMEMPCKLSKKGNWEIHINVLIKRYNCFCIITFFEHVRYVQERNISPYLTWNNCRCLIWDKNIFDQTKLYRSEVFYILMFVVSKNWSAVSCNDLSSVWSAKYTSLCLWDFRASRWWRFLLRSCGLLHFTTWSVGTKIPKDLPSVLTQKTYTHNLPKLLFVSSYY